MKSYLIVVLAFTSLLCITARASEFDKPWLDENTSIVLDPYHGNKTPNWTELAKDKKVVGIIHKATEGNGTDSAYAARRLEALNRNYLWGSYHLLTTSDVEAQIKHYIKVAGENGNEAYAIDVECLSGDTNCQSESYEVSYESIEAALREFKKKTQRLPLIYTNGSVGERLAKRFEDNPEFAGLKLWYARFRSKLDMFPIGQWKTYTLWQFSYEDNCFPKPGTCPYRVPGISPDIDVNVYFGSPAQLRRAWPLN